MMGDESDSSLSLPFYFIIVPEIDSANSAGKIGCMGDG
jgi:hypothetical protein